MKLRPTTLNPGGGSGSFEHKEGYTAEMFDRWFNVPGVPHSAVFWNGHQFEICGFKIFRIPPTSSTWYYRLWDPEVGLHLPIESTPILYYPLDPRTNRTDWEGATRAYPNEDNTAWLPEHDDADHMRDREVELRAGLVAVLQPVIDDLEEAVLTATDNKPSNWPLGEPWENRLTRRLKLNDVLRFRKEATKCLLAEARKRHIGWYQQNPEKSHLHDLVHDCITTTLRAEGNPYSRVFSELRDAAVSLAPHAYETRWDQEARLKAEAAEAAQESAQDQGSAGADQ